jgi:hypothetical protein
MATSEWGQGVYYLHDTGAGERMCTSIFMRAGHVPDSLYELLVLILGVPTRLALSHNFIANVVDGIVMAVHAFRHIFDAALGHLALEHRSGNAAVGLVLVILHLVESIDKLAGLLAHNLASLLQLKNDLV